MATHEIDGIDAGHEGEHEVEHIPITTKAWNMMGSAKNMAVGTVRSIRGKSNPILVKSGSVHEQIED
jgi:hypothetical protein